MRKLAQNGFLAPLALLITLLIGTNSAAPADNTGWRQSFHHPPASARPWVYWFWLNGNISSNGITADLEAMKRVGIGGVLIMEVDQGAPKGPADFGGPRWRELFKHVCAEASRLGLEVNMNNDAGWCGSGGPWITPALAMQKLVWTETSVSGPARFEAALPHPQTISNYYGDIAVFAFPTPEGNDRIENIQAKAGFEPDKVKSGADYGSVSSNSVIGGSSISNLTSHLDAKGRLSWEVPPGRWTILRMGHTPTGADNHPAPEPGRGLESDKLSKAATDAMFAGLMAKLIDDSKPLAGPTLVSTHIDSWETGSQNWTPLFRQDFQRLRGYDPLPFLPVVTGRVIESAGGSERFLWDLRLTVSDLLIQNYAGRFRELANARGLRLSIEAYDRPPCDEMTFAGQADEPMAEFWSWGYNAAYSCTEMASAAHTYGRRILGAEAFTASDGEKWLHHPASIKALGDWAFCEGINRFVFHRYALQPWLQVEPGMSMGPWGLHYERTQTWWEQSVAWHEYLARCQFLLRQGLFVADICYLQPEGSPQRFLPGTPGRSGNTPERPSYNFDGCTPEVLLTRMQVRDGRLVLPDGMSYRLLVLPEIQTMTPALLRKVGELVKAGATVLGPPPSQSPSLSGYPACDQEVQKLSREIWADPGLFTQPGQPPRERTFGPGHVVWSPDFARQNNSGREANTLRHAQWIWAREGNPAVAAPPGHRYFRRPFVIDPAQPVATARVSVTADNSFDLWINGRLVGAGGDFNTIFNFDITPFVKPGTNLIAIAALNGDDKPNPAGLIASLEVKFADHHSLTVDTSRAWETIKTPGPEWNLKAVPSPAWAAAMELGPLGMAPWAGTGKTDSPLYEYPAFNAVTNLLARLGLPPDFESPGRLRYIHRHAPDTGVDIYFVANPETNWVGATCSFRVTGKRPELWNPLTGEIRPQLAFREKERRTELPLSLEPVGSIFVIFRNADANGNAEPSPITSVKRDGLDVWPAGNEPSHEPPVVELAAGGANETSPSSPAPALLAWKSGGYTIADTARVTREINVPAIPEPIKIGGPWLLRFQPNRGAPESVTLDTLADWSRHANPGVRYFSGVASYSNSFALPEGFLGQNRRLYLDLGRVAVIARARVNGTDLGILWKPPFRAEITGVARTGGNQLEIEVVNLWPNRMIGDEQLPEDSSRNSNGTLKKWPEWFDQGKPSPSGRVTFTSWRLWKKDSPLLESGLLGPVRLVTAQTVEIRR